VPRTWTHLLATVAGAPIDPETLTPQRWRDDVRTMTGRTAPASMTDGCDPVYRHWDAGYNPDSALDRCVEQARQEIFPWHGLHFSY
jgi:acetoin utilization protein AcuC